jgi:two-component system, cell cycle sensor histidine kinase and response regulator CckA
MNVAGEPTTTEPEAQLQSLGRLAGGLAHDVNNLLLVIRDYVDSASKALTDGNTSAARDGLAGAVETVERAGRMTQGLLTAVSPRPRPSLVYHMNAILDSMETLLRDVVGHDIELVLEQGPDVPDLTGAPALIEQVILNLVLNARDAISGRGRVTITTSTLSATRPEAGLPAALYVILTVADNGDGMDKETREKVFDPFFSTKPGTSSSGLGLTTVREIAIRHGGEVHIHHGTSGTTVTVTLPTSSPDTGPDDPHPHLP